MRRRIARRRRSSRRRCSRRRGRRRPLDGRPDQPPGPDDHRPRRGRREPWTTTKGAGAGRRPRTVPVAALQGRRDDGLVVLQLLADLRRDDVRSTRSSPSISASASAVRVTAPHQAGQGHGDVCRDVRRHDRERHARHATSAPTILGSALVGSSADRLRPAAGSATADHLLVPVAALRHGRQRLQRQGRGRTRRTRSSRRTPARRCGSSSSPRTPVARATPSRTRPTSCRTPAPADRTAMITLPNGDKSIDVKDVPKGERLIVEKVSFDPNPLVSPTGPILARIKVEDTRGYVVRNAIVFIRSTPLVTSGGDNSPTATDGWVTYQLVPRQPLEFRGLALQFFVKAYRKGDRRSPASRAPASCRSRSRAERDGRVAIGPRRSPPSRARRLPGRCRPHRKRLVRVPEALDAGRVVNGESARGRPRRSRMPRTRPSPRASLVATALSQRRSRCSSLPATAGPAVRERRSATVTVGEPTVSGTAATGRHADRRRRQLVGHDADLVRVPLAPLRRLRARAAPTSPERPRPRTCRVG